MPAFLESGGGIRDASGIFEAATAQEYEFDHRLILDIFRCVSTAAEKSVMREDIWSCQGNCLGFHSPHRETSHSTVRLIGQGTEIVINVGDQFVHQDCLEGFYIEIP